MSMWEIESLVEDGIRLVATTSEDKKKLIGNLYAIQKAFDCSFTNFRVMDILLETGYTTTVHYSQHPDYKGNEAFFDGLLAADDISYVYRDIKEEWSEENEMVGYLERSSGLLYMDYGSPLRTGEPALEKMSVFELGLLLIRAAHEQGRKELVYDWTGFLLNTGPGFVARDTAVAIVIEKYFAEIREIWLGYDHAGYEPLSDMFFVYSKGSEAPEHFEWILESDHLRGKLLRWFISF